MEGKTRKNNHLLFCIFETCQYSIFCSAAATVLYFILNLIKSLNTLHILQKLYKYSAPILLFSLSECLHVFKNLNWENYQDFYFLYFATNSNTIMYIEHNGMKGKK